MNPGLKKKGGGDAKARRLTRPNKQGQQPGALSRVVTKKKIGKRHKAN